MYALWNPPINKLMNNYIYLKHYTCTCSGTALINTKLVMKVIFVEIDKRYLKDFKYKFNTIIGCIYRPPSYKLKSFNELK